MREDWEWSVEANPASLTPGKLAILRDHGVGRISMGVQSFDADLLRLMGRAHGVQDAEEALDLLAGSGLRWSADLIFALPGQTPSGFLSGLERLLSWSPSHVSFYGLTWEAGTPFRKSLDEGRLAEVDEEDYERMYVQGVERLAREGIERYEVSNFARPGQECRHNLSYWDVESSWLAAGNSAHGYKPWKRWRNPRGLSAWMSWADRGFPPDETAPEELGLEERWTEAWFLGLRTATGVDLDRLDGLFPYRVDEGRLARWVDAGRMRRQGRRLTLHGDGWMLLDAIVADLSMV